jgi:hypothetical protein
MIGPAFHLFDARLLRLTVVVALLWNCILPSALFACHCTGDLHLKPADGQCSVCAAKSDGSASCCQAKSSKTACCRHASSQGKTKQVSAANACDDGCCVEIQNRKAPAVVLGAKAVKQADVDAIPMAVVPVDSLARASTAELLALSTPPPASISRHILFCVWRN